MKALVGLLLAICCFQVQAESRVGSGSGSPTSVGASVDFQITIPKVLYLRVGSGSSHANNPTINKIDFLVPTAGVGTGPVGATPSSGDLGHGSVTAQLYGNNGAITLSTSTLGALQNGDGDSISYTQIQTSVGLLSTSTALAAPSIIDGGTNTTTIAGGVGKVINRDATWTYSYLNNQVMAPGTYGGTNTNNGRVTYTATMP